MLKIYKNRTEIKLNVLITFMYTLYKLNYQTHYETKRQ